MTIQAIQKMNSGVTIKYIMNTGNVEVKAVMYYT